MRRIIPGAVLSLALLLAVRPVPLLADATDELRQGLKEVDQKLRVKDWGAAERQARKLAQRTADEVGTGPAAAHSLAVATAFLAIAEAGLAQVEDAAWHWDMALNLDLEIAKVSVSPYGAGAEGLHTRQLRPTPQPGMDAGLRIVGGNGGAQRTAIELPKAIKAPRPEYPRVQGTQGLVIIEAIIGIDGRPREPHVLSAQSAGPGMVFAALEALRQWRFEPARLEGKPVEVYYTLSVTFHVGR